MKKSLLMLAVFAMTSPYALAQDEVPKVKTEFGVDYTTQYFFRGLHQEGEGLLIQPYLEVSGNFFEDIDFTAGIWNSLHDGSTGTDGGLKPWYESDLYFGFDYGVGDLGIYLTYLELGIEPSYQATKEISITVPMTIGFSLGDHYENAAGKDQDLGFWSVGVNASMPVSSWELSVGIQYLQLDDFTKTLNGGGSELIGTIGPTSWFLWTFSAYPQEQRVEMKTLTDA